MNAAAAHPIYEDVHEAERDPERMARYVHPDLDLDYIERVAVDLAVVLASGYPGECAYQPGDGSCYRLVLVPMRSLVATSPRVGRDGRKWQTRIDSGMLDRDSGPDKQYAPNAYLLSIVEGSGQGAYPIWLGRGMHSLALGYVAEHWGLSGTSAFSVALLLRRVSRSLNTLRERTPTYDMTEAAAFRALAYPAGATVRLVPEENL